MPVFRLGFVRTSVLSRSEWNLLLTMTVSFPSGPVFRGAQVLPFGLSLLAVLIRATLPQLNRLSSIANIHLKMPQNPRLRLPCCGLLIMDAYYPKQFLLFSSLGALLRLDAS